MQPIFKEMLQFWRDSGYDLPLQEGTFWLENRIIKGFTSDGKSHSLYKYHVNDDLSIEIIEHKDLIKNRSLDFETWEDTAKRLKDHLEGIESDSIQIIRDTLTEYPEHVPYAMTSTGKDSSIIVHLCKKVIPDIKIMFNNTSIDCIDTYRIVNQHDEWIKTNPDEGFYQYIKRLNIIPTRFSRFCCNLYKETASIKYLKNAGENKVIMIMGVRNCESNARQNRKTLERNPKWDRYRGTDWYSLLPIHTWSDLDVWLYVFSENLEINPKYRKGYNRVGCAIACPYYTKSTWTLDRYWYPKMYERWHKILEQDFLKNQKWQQLNCTLEEYHSCWPGGLLRPDPTEEVICELMEHKGITDHDVAIQFFNKKCDHCGKNIRQNDVLAMNMRMFGRETENFLCKKCLMSKAGISLDAWNDMVNSFKTTGCELF